MKVPIPQYILDGKKISPIELSQLEQLKVNGFSEFEEPAPIRGDIIDGVFNSYPAGADEYFLAEYQIKMFKKGIGLDLEEVILVICKYMEPVTWQPTCGE